jgi:alpha-L-fucosidase 2
MSKLLAHAFDQYTGVLSVDFAGYLSKHDIVYNIQNSIPSEGLPVGNGKVGAMVWNTSGGLTMQVTNVDGSPSTQLSSGLISLYTNPGLDIEYTDYEQRLNLHDGLVTIKYDSDRTVTIFGDTNSELLGIHVDDSRSGLSAVSLDLSIWDTSGLANSGWDKDIPDIESWKIVNTWVNFDLIAISRGLADPDHFGYTLAASVEGAAFKTQTVNSTTLRLHITPSPSYTIWIANPSRQNSADYDAAAALIVNAKSSGYTKYLTTVKPTIYSAFIQPRMRYT